MTELKCPGCGEWWSWNTWTGLDCYQNKEGTPAECTFLTAGDKDRLELQYCSCGKIIAICLDDDDGVSVMEQVYFKKPRRSNGQFAQGYKKGK